MSDFDPRGLTIAGLGAEIDEESRRISSLEQAIDKLPAARERLAALKAEMASRVAPEQPKDTSNEDSTETMVEASDDIVPASLPITPMAPLTAEAQEVWDDNLGALYEDGPFNGVAPNGQAQE